MAIFSQPLAHKPPRPHRFRPTLETLEDRLAPAAPGGPLFSPTDTAAFGAASFSNQGQPNPYGGGGAQAGQGISNPGLTATAFSTNTVGVINSNTAAFFNTGSGSFFTTPFNTGSSAELTAVTQALFLTQGVLPAYGPPTLPSVAPPGTSGQTAAAVVVDVEQTSLRVFSPFALFSFVPPQTPPPRAVTLFAPSGGGPTPQQEGLVPPGGPPGVGVPGAPGALPGRAPAGSFYQRPPMQGTGGPSGGQQTPSGGETPPPKPPATPQVPLSQSSPTGEPDRSARADTPSLGKMPPPPVHAPDTKVVARPGGFSAEESAADV